MIGYPVHADISDSSLRDADHKDAGHRIIRAAAHMAYNPYECERRETTVVGNIGGQRAR